MAKKITKIEPVGKKLESESAPPKRVCAYCRVSTGSPEQKMSFESQTAYYTRLIESKEDWIYAGIYADH